MNKSRLLVFAIATSISSGIAQADTIYCVHDDGLNDSQFCQIPIPPGNKVLPLGPSYQNCDIEALDIYHSDALFLAASGDNTPRRGHIYKMDANNGNLFDLGNAVNMANGANLTEIDAISFHPNTGNLWGWAQHVPPGQMGGLFVITNDQVQHSGTQIQSCEIEPVVEDIPATIVIEPDVAMEIEAITWNWNGTALYGVENCHKEHHPDSHGEGENSWPKSGYDFDFDCGIKLWVGQTHTAGTDNLDQQSWTPVCQTLGLTESIDERLAELYPNVKARPVAEIEALESLPPKLASVNNDNDDLVLIGFHGPRHLLYALISIPPLPNLNHCQFRWVDDIDSGSFNDIEGLAYFENPIIPKSCLEIKTNAPSTSNGVYQIDPDGEGGNEPFEVYCDMTHEGGGWTLYAYHADGIATIQAQELVKPSNYAVMTDSHWLAVRDSMTTGMMFLDEQGRVSTISASKLKSANCISIQQVSDLTNNVGSYNIWHNENSGCNTTGSDYSLIHLTGKKYGGFGISGAALYQESFLKFDKWPYSANSSYNQQNTLLYFIK